MLWSGHDHALPKHESQISWAKCDCLVQRDQTVIVVIVGFECKLSFVNTLGTKWLYPEIRRLEHRDVAEVKNWWIFDYAP